MLVYGTLPSTGFDGNRALRFWFLRKKDYYRRRSSAGADEIRRDVAKRRQWAADNALRRRRQSAAAPRGLSCCLEPARFSLIRFVRGSLLRGDRTPALMGPKVAAIELFVPQGKVCGATSVAISEIKLMRRTKIYGSHQVCS